MKRDAITAINEVTVEKGKHFVTNAAQGGKTAVHKGVLLTIFSKKNRVANYSHDEVQFK